MHIKRCPRQHNSAKECTRLAPPDTGPSANEIYPTYFTVACYLQQDQSYVRRQRHLKPGVPPDCFLLHTHLFAHSPLWALAREKNLKHEAPSCAEAPTKVDSMQRACEASAHFKCANFSDKLCQRLPNEIRISIKKSRRTKHSPD